MLKQGIMNLAKLVSQYVLVCLTETLKNLRQYSVSRSGIKPGTSSMDVQNFIGHTVSV